MLLSLDQRDVIVSQKKIQSLYDLDEISSGNLQVFVTRNFKDIKASQALRYQVFFEEMGAKPTPAITASKLDIDDFDSVCDHLLVVEHQDSGDYRVVGTYRLLRREAMQEIGRFYSDSEYDISLIKNYNGGILEVGRSCVHSDFRNRSVMQLLWRGIGAYVVRFRIDYMFGCASFAGTDPISITIILRLLIFVRARLRIAMLK
jgi:L-ornithine Nalpha-acyltransferase